MTGFKREKKAILLVALVLLLGLSVIACGRTSKYLATSAIVEVGVPFEAHNFLTASGHTAEFDKEFADKYATNNVARILVPGNYRVDLLVDGKRCAVKLTVRDTVAPVAKAKEIFICEGGVITPEQCVTDVYDVTEVKYSFKTKPDTSKTGKYQAVVVITDAADNKTEVIVDINIISLTEALARGFEVEAGTEVPDVSKLMPFADSKKIITDLSVINIDLVGTYDITVEIEGKEYETTLNIIDTIAPVATITPQEGYEGVEFPSPESFVSNIIDAGPVKVSFETDPGVVSKDNTAVKIVLTDQGGNKTVYDSYCNIAVDNEAPVILSAPDKLDVDAGASIIWRALVNAKDNSGVVDLELDTSKVDMQKPGYYTAVLYASDKAGNKVSKNIEIVVHDNSVTLEMMDELCSKIIAKVIKDGMSKQEQVLAIAQYVHDNIRYTDARETDLRKDAYLGLTTRKNGNCYTYYSACVELLSRLGFETMMVCRSEEAVEIVGSHHVWAYVNMGDALYPQWYHCDASAKPRAFERNTFLITTAQTIAYTKWREAEEKPPKLRYFTFDHSQYPESATTELVDINVNKKYFE